MLGKLRYVFGRILCFFGAHKAKQCSGEWGGSGADGFIVYYQKCERKGCTWSTPPSNYNS